MKINKKINCSRMAASYLFLGTLAIFIGSGATLCLANTADVNNSDELERAIGDSNMATINIKADSITLDRKLPAISRKLTISGKTYRKSILYGNNVQKILEFNPNLSDITINNISFQNGHNKCLVSPINLLTSLADDASVYDVDGRVNPGRFLELFRERLFLTYLLALPF
ncbi:MAG: hypothetical protein LBP39_00805 [Rickettsiales bacterium]|nr:hypothetical protein [Rickettsiales bacterium]